MTKEKPFTENDFRFTYKKGYLYAFQMNPNGESASNTCHVHYFGVNSYSLTYSKNTFMAFESHLFL